MLAIPKNRGSCTGSSVLLELILNGHGPAALILEQPDEILVLGAIVAELVFEHHLPVVSVGGEAFQSLRDAGWASLGADAQLTLTNDCQKPETLLSDAADAPSFSPPAHGSIS